ncbi:MAG: H-NS histone family protein [Pseudomonadota bacterium]
MAKINLEKMSREELVSLQKSVEEALKASERQAKKNALAAAQKAAAEHGFTLEEVLSGKRGAPGPKSVPKYDNPDDPSQTWTGRGRQPKWVKSALAAGKSLDQMTI